jgi:hypothetical protein
MSKIYLVDESLNEFAKRGRPKKVKEEPEMEDNWYSADDEFDAPEVGPEEIEDIELEDEVTELSIQKQLKKMVDNELTIPEASRALLKVTKRSTGEVIEGRPLAKLSAGEAVLVSTKAGPKKVRFDDMIVESSQPTQYVSESFKDYE